MGSINKITNKEDRVHYWSINELISYNLNTRDV